MAAAEEVMAMCQELMLCVSAILDHQCSQEKRSKYEEVTTLELQLYGLYGTSTGPYNCISELIHFQWKLSVEIS